MAATADGAATARTYPGDWKYIFTLDNPSSAPLTSTATSSITLPDSMTGSIESSQSLDAWGLDIFSVKENITVGRSIAKQMTTTETFTAAPSTQDRERAEPGHHQSPGVVARGLGALLFQLERSAEPGVSSGKTLIIN